MMQQHAGQCVTMHRHRRKDLGHIHLPEHGTRRLFVIIAQPPAEKC